MHEGLAHGVDPCSNLTVQYHLVRQEGAKGIIEPAEESLYYLYHV